MYQLNEKLVNLEPYEPIAGEYSVRLDANESFHAIDAETMKKLQQALSEVAFNRYPDAKAQGVREAFGKLYGIDSRYITAGNGSDELISVITSTFLQSGERLMTITPDFSMYRFYAQLYEILPVDCSKDENLTISVDRIITCAKEQKANCIIFSNPCNPTGQGICREEILRLVQSVECLVVVDEAYMDFWNQSILEYCTQYDNLIVLKTCSKALGTAALRLGFAIANETITKALQAAKSPYNVNSVTQKLGEVLLSNSTLIQKNLDQILQSRDWLYTAVKALEAPNGLIEKVYPTCTNFIFMRCKDAKGVWNKLKQQGIIIRQMGEFLRITCGTEKENQQLMAALTAIVNK